MPNEKSMPFGAGKAPLILIVDDSGIARATARRILENAGYRISEAESTRDAIRLFAAERPDVVIMDLMMDDLDGLVAIQAIRKLDPDAGIIVSSATADPHYVVSAAKLQIAAFLQKPTEPQRLVATVEKVVASRPG